MAPDEACRLGEGIAGRLGAGSAGGRCACYLRLLSKWQRVHNLAGTRSLAGLAGLAADCAPLVQRACQIDAGQVADLGSGAGMPGLLLAIARPQLPIALIESRSSKAAFLRQAVMELELDNVRVICIRIESWRPARPPGLLCARALAPLPALAELVAGLGGRGLRLLALKSRSPRAECAALERTGRWQVASCLPTGGAPSRWLVEAQARQ